MQGPITVFDGQAYAGDARMEDLAPGQERLVTYALDLKTEVEPKAEAGQQELVNVSVKKGVLIATHMMREEHAYHINYRDQKEKTLLIEHPYRADWQLIEPAKPSERTRDVYRFTLPIDGGKTAVLRVREEKQLTQTVQLIDSGPETIMVTANKFDSCGYRSRASVRNASCINRRPPGLSARATARNTR